jgi:hypothetical protein
MKFLKEQNTVLVFNFTTNMKFLRNKLHIPQKLSYNHLLFEIIDNLSKNKFPITVLWHYKNDEELEIGNE